MIRSQWDKYKKGLNIGFIRSDNRLVVDIEECKIAEPALNLGIDGGSGGRFVSNSNMVRSTSPGPIEHALRISCEHRGHRLGYA